MNENFNVSSNILLFDSKEVRLILKRIIGCNLDKIFLVRK